LDTTPTAYGWLTAARTDRNPSVRRRRERLTANLLPGRSVPAQNPEDSVVNEQKLELRFAPECLRSHELYQSQGGCDPLLSLPMPKGRGFSESF